MDDFDGFGQGLRLEEGPYTIEIVAPGFEPLSFDVRIQRGRQITYEGDLIPEGAPAPVAAGAVTRSSRGDSGRRYSVSSCRSI